MDLQNYVLGVDGSPVRSGTVSQMLEVVLKDLESAGTIVKRVKLKDYALLPHNGDLTIEGNKKNTADDEDALKELILHASAVVFATPVHWFNMSSYMKLFMDRLTSLESKNFLLEGKPVGIITYGPEGGALNAAQLMLMIVNQWGMITPPYGAVFDEGRGDEWVKRDLKLLAKNLRQLISISQKQKPNWDYV